MRSALVWWIASAFGLVVTLLAWTASAAPGQPQLQYVYGGSAGTVVFIHGKGDCSRQMSDCNGGDSTSGPAAYWTNDSNDATMLNEGTTAYASNGSPTYYEAFAIGYDLDNQGFWYSANDVGYCLQDLYQGTNNSGCNPSHYQRSYFHIVTHSAGGTVIDRLLSTGWYGINAHGPATSSPSPPRSRARARRVPSTESTDTATSARRSCRGSRDGRSRATAPRR